MMHLLILGALVAVAAAGNLGYAGYAPSLGYAAPRIEYPVAALPAPVYHAPAVQFASSYRQDTYHAAPRAYGYASYAPAPVFQAAPIHAPIVSSGYSYQTAPLLKTYAAPAPVYSAPLLTGYPAASHKIW